MSNEELWDREQVRLYLGMRSINSVGPWLSRHEVSPAAYGEPAGGGVRYFYSATVIRTVAASLPGSPGRGNPHRPRNGKE